ncbi:MAG: hypothetical protein IJU84_07005 [Clostridia bacterium]|nr:hypothetical protein [Clostridia bacterium]
MKKFHGFTDDEIRALALLAETARKNNGKLSDVFAEFARKTGRAKGSVRNFYYEFLRACGEDESLAKEYFSSAPKVNRARAFDEEETNKLLLAVREGRRENKSVRRSIIELAGGDEKLTLRYQNKYRSLAKSKAGEGESAEKFLPVSAVRRVKAEINALVERIALSVRDENDRLKKKADLLEQENAMLKGILGKLNGEKLKDKNVI